MAHELIEGINYMLFRIYEMHRDGDDAGAYWDLHLVLDDDEMWQAKHRHSDRVFIQSKNIQTVHDALSGIVEYLVEVGK